MLHERTRTLLCRTGFLVLCLLPTLVIAGAAARFRSQSYLEARREEWCAVLSDHLGLDVQIGQVRYPLWNTAQLADVRLIDPEDGQQIFAAQLVEVVQEESTWRIALSLPEVNASALHTWQELVEHRLLRGPALKFPSLKLKASSLTVTAAAGGQTYERVRAELATTDSGKQLKLEFAVPGERDAEPLQISVQRIRGSATPTTHYRFHTGDRPAACDALQSLVPPLAHLGREATFQGSMAAQQSDSQWKWEVVGTFDRVSLEQVGSSQHCPYKVSGTAAIAIDALRLTGGTVSEARGSLRTQGGGVVSRALLAAAQSQLGLTPQIPPKLGEEQLVRYSHLAFGFELDRRGLAITGDADPAHPGTIMASAAAGTLLAESSRAVVPLPYLQMPAQLGSIQVASAAEESNLLNLLPIRLFQRVPAEQLPRAKLRLKPR
jgi:hypothetical protein